MTTKEMFKIMSEHVDVNKIGTGSSLTAGNESIDGFAAASDEERLKTLADSLALGFEEISNSRESDIKIDTYQVELATSAAALAVKPLEALSEITKSPKAPKIEVGSEKLIMNVDQYTDMNEIISGFEAFDGQTVMPNVHFSVLFTAMAAKQDEGAELFFPIVPMDAKTSGATVTTTITSIINDFNRPIDGSVNKAKFNKTPLVKIANDPEKIDVDKNRLVPVKRAESADNFVPGTEHVVNYNGEPVETAALKVGKEVNLLGISQTDSMLAKGSMNITDALDASVKVTALYFKLNDENFKFNIDTLGVAYTYSVTDHNKDIVLNMTTDSLGFNTTDTTQADGSASTVVANLPDNYTVKVRVKLNGDGNTQIGDIALYVNQMEMVSVINAGGAEIPTTHDDYIAIKEVFDTIQPTGYEVEAFLTNTNSRIRGVILTSDSYTAVYNVPFRSGYTVITPVVSNGTDGDADSLNTAVNFARLKMNAAAYKTLSNFIALMRNTGPEVDLQGVANKFVNKFFTEESVDLSTIVDGIRSGERREDIKEALFLKIRVAAAAAYVQSNYGVALQATRPGVKPTVIIATDPVIGMVLMEGGLKDDELFNYRVGITNNPEMTNRIVSSFAVMTNNRNKMAEPLNFGQCFLAPDLIIPVVKTVDNSTAVENTVMNRYLHSINLPILNVINVSGIETVIGKLSVNMKTV